MRNQGLEGKEGLKYLYKTVKRFSDLNLRHDIWFEREGRGGEKEREGVKECYDIILHMVIVGV